MNDSGPGLIASQDEAAEGLSAPVKLVVWDLDDTLWTGTLSEGPVVLDSSRVELVRALNDRGIVNAICSKNDEDDARSRLQQAGLWDEFVFARIDWSPKGPRLAQIVEDTQLRPENVLFIDDLPLNRGEVRHFVPDIQTAGPEIIPLLLSSPQLAGKDDRDRTRQHQYQVLERKLVDRQAAAGSSEAFLRSCDIHVTLFHDSASEHARLLELVNRTHQLNFTKRALDEHQFRALVDDPGYQTGYVTVRDRYGEYGICGFYSLSLDDGELKDFLFSCRVLHMGLEQWLYEQLGRPPLTIVGDVASSLDGQVDWITADDVAESGRTSGPDGPAPGGGALEPSTTAPQPHRILMVGGCDLNTTAQFLGGDIATEFAHTGPNGTFIHMGHTETLRQSLAGLSPEEWAIVDRIPFLDRQVYTSSVVLSPHYDVLVYSVLTDYTQGLYRHRRLGLVAPWLQYNRDITDPAIWPSAEKRLGRQGVDRDFLQWFSQEFAFEGGISPERFEENVRWLAAAIPDRAQLIFVNGAEVPFDNPREPERHLHHQQMNAVLDRVAAELPNTTICDVRTFVLGEDDFTDSIRHYQRQAYLRMAEGIRAAGASNLRVEPGHWLSRAFTECYKFAGRRRLQAQKLVKRLRGSPGGRPR